jgi:hypothetical protein
MPNPNERRQAVHSRFPMKKSGELHFHPSRGESASPPPPRNPIPLNKKNRFFNNADLP